MSAERLDHFMARANAAYYAERDPFADFTTAPEISQVFGEILGAWTVVVWRSMRTPRPFILAEAGPGRGTLMADALRLIRRLAPDCMAALRLHLIETSPRLRAAQQAALSGMAPVLQHMVWHDHAAMLPDGPLILLANEFLDALPIRQHRRSAGGWEERYLDGGGEVWRAALPPPGPAGLRAVPVGGVIETCEAALDLIEAVSARLRSQPGAALLLDYGPGQAGYGDTLQALRAGAPSDPLGPAGEADLTAHVDFPALRTVARGVRVHGPVPQGRFLSELGLFARIDRLSRSVPAAQAADLALAAHRLTNQRHMGSLFKAMALCHPSLAAPPGFGAAQPEEAAS